MRYYIFHVYGRPLGAIGINFRFYVPITGETPEKALINLYNRKVQDFKSYSDSRYCEVTDTGLSPDEFEALTTKYNFTDKNLVAFMVNYSKELEWKKVSEIG